MSRVTNRDWLQGVYTNNLLLALKSITHVSNTIALYLMIMLLLDNSLVKEFTIFSLIGTQFIFTSFLYMIL
jgi:hypothetical protein